jgi:DNA-binding IclR family transcriptional regulator
MLSTVLHALQVLEHLAEVSEAGVSEISRAVGLAPSTTHRLLAALASKEFLQQNPKTKKYQLGIKIFQLGSSVANRFGIRQAALVNMEKLAAESGETVNLGILNRAEVIYLEKILNDDPIRIELQVGHSVPAHCTAMGKAILAFQPPEKLEEIISSIKFEKRTNTTIADRESLRLELAAIKSKGYAIDDGELIEGIKCISAPVVLHQKGAVAAISIAGPSFRLTAARVTELVPLVRKAADETSKYIQWASSGGI